MAVSVRQEAKQWERNIQQIQAVATIPDRATAAMLNVGASSAESVASHMEEAVRRNAPINIGTLRDAVAVRVSNAGTTVNLNLEIPVAYAGFINDNLTPVGPKQLGERSAQQPPTPEGGVGGWFIERAIQHNTPRWTQFIAKGITAGMNRLAGLARGEHAALPEGAGIDIDKSGVGQFEGFTGFTG